jgi:hypothetical protein
MQTFKVNLSGKIAWREWTRKKKDIVAQARDGIVFKIKHRAV